MRIKIGERCVRFIFMVSRYEQIAKNILTKDANLIIKF